MDDAIAIITLAGSSFLLSGSLLQIYLSKIYRKNSKELKYSSSSLNNFYKKYKFFILLLFFISLITTSILNIYFQIHVIGLVPGRILPYPLNAITAWALNTGFVLLISHFIYLETKNDKFLKLSNVIVFLVTCFICSATILSRGHYVYAFLALICCLFSFKQKGLNISFYMFFKIIFIASAMYIILIFTVTVSRDFFYSDVSFFSSPSSIFSSQSSIHLSRVLKLILSLAVDRWVGIEGVMAVLSYQEKSLEVLTKSIFDVPAGFSTDIYQKMSLSHYEQIDKTRFSFSTLPGIVAYLYYSGSKLIVTLGCIFAIFLMVGVEKLTKKVLNSTILISIIGITLASSFAQFGGAPLNLIKFLALTLFFILGLKSIEYILSQLLKKLVTIQP